MNIYEIDRRIEDIYENAINAETGEISPEAFEELDALQMERDGKIENMGLWHKNTVAESKAIAEEISNLQKRKKALDNRAEWQKRYLIYALHGEKFSSPKLAISYRKSETVEFDNEELFCTENADDALIVTTTITRKPNKMKLKEYLKDGFNIIGCRLEEHSNIQIR